MHRYQRKNLGAIWLGLGARWLERIWGSGLARVLRRLSTEIQNRVLQIAQYLITVLALANTELRSWLASAVHFGAIFPISFRPIPTVWIAPLTIPNLIGSH